MPSNGSYLSSRIPQSSFSNPNTPRFYPPSYYAAAAGVSGSNSSSNKDSYDDYDTSTANYIPSSHEELAQTSSDTFRVKRRFSISSLKSSGSITHSSSTLKQSSHIEALPSLEASLLPSLRDTVQRMTKPLSRSNSRSTGSASASSFDSTSLQSADLPVITTVSPTRSSTQNSPEMHEAGLDYAQKGQSMARGNCETPSKLRNKPSLKSALRPPKVSNIATKYKRDDSGHENTPNRIGHQDTLFPARPSRARSRTDPGIDFSTPVTAKTPRSNKVGHTSNPKTKVSHTGPSGTRLEQPFPTPVKVQYGLPRRAHTQNVVDSDVYVSATKQGSDSYFRTPSRLRLSRSIPSTPAPPSSTSDFESTYAGENKRKSRLIVTNADIVSSSSTSSDDMPLNQRATRLRKPGSSLRWGSSNSTDSTSSDHTSSITVTNSPRTPTRKQEGIGLGIMMPDGDHVPKYGSIHGKKRQAKELNSAEPDEKLSVRQRVALLGIVDGLGLRTPQPNRNSFKRTSQARDDSSLSLVGLAISSSGDMKQHCHARGNYDNHQECHSKEGELDWQAHHRNGQLPKNILDYYGRSHQTPIVQHQPLTQPAFPDVNSDISLAGIADRWQEDEDENERGGLGLSHGAEALFQGLGRRLKVARGSKSAAHVSKMDYTTPHIFQQSDSLPSMYEDEDDAEGMASATPVEEDFIFRPGSTKVATSDPHTSFASEKSQRTNLFRTYLASETEYLSLLDSTISLFVLPLRIRETREWVTGVPPEIAQLFDWLEDIRNVHQRSFEALSSIIFHASDERMSESIKRTLVPGLEVYQPYLIQLDQVLKMVKKCISDKEDDFGQFTRIQESDGQAAAYGNLEIRLLEPVRKLSKYPEVFKEFLDATEKDDDDYVSTVCLVRATCSVVQAMTEIKAREDEYKFIKITESRLQGLPHMLSLARRDRRLLVNGTVSIARLVKSGSQLLHSDLQPRTSSSHSRRRSMLAEAVDKLERGRRSGFVSTSPPLHTSDLESLGAKRDQAGTNLRSTEQQVAHFSELGLLDCMVFSDMLLISDSSTRRVLNEIGTCHIIDINVDTAASTIVLGVIPMVNPNELQLTGSIRTIRLSITATEQASGTENIQTWASALTRCQRKTLEIMTLAAAGISVTSPVANNADDKLTSIIRSGMPFPKSPSMQVEERGLFGARDGRELEREARGWWSLQFEKVMREMHPHA